MSSLSIINRKKLRKTYKQCASVHVPPKGKVFPVLSQLMSETYIGVQYNDVVLRTLSDILLLGSIISVSASAEAATGGVF